MGVVDQPLPAGRRARLLEVHPHRHAQLVAERAGLADQARGVLERRLGIVHAARDRPPPAAGRRRRRGSACTSVRPADHHLRRAHSVSGSSSSSVARRDQRLEPLDPLVADRICGLDAARVPSGSRGRGRRRAGIRRASCRRPRPRRAPARRTARTRRPRSAWGPSQIASSGFGCTSTMIPSAPAAAAASDSGPTRSRRPAAWLGSTITGRWRELLQHRHRHQVEREPVGGLERADPALAQHHRVVALLEDVLGGHQQLVERRGQAALEQRRAAAAPDLGEQRVVLHVAGADLDHVGDLERRRRDRACPSAR